MKEKREIRENGHVVAYDKIFAKIHLLFICTKALLVNFRMCLVCNHNFFLILIISQQKSLNFRQKTTKLCYFLGLKSLIGEGSDLVVECLTRD